MKKMILVLATTVLGMLTCGGSKSDNSVKGIPVTGIALNKTELMLAKGESEKLTVTVLPENATDKNVKIDFAKAKKTVNGVSIENIEVSSDGTVTGIGDSFYMFGTPAAGYSFIPNTVYALLDYDYDGHGSSKATAKCEVYSIDTISHVELDKTSLTLGVGASERLYALGYPDGPHVYKFESSNPEVATLHIDQSINYPLIKTNSKGNATITVTVYNGYFPNATAWNNGPISIIKEEWAKTATCEVTVTPTPSGEPILPRMSCYMVAKQPPYLFNVGETRIVGSDIYDYNIRDVASWDMTNSNPSVIRTAKLGEANQFATIANGPGYQVWGLASGVATITFSATLTNGYTVSASMTITVQ
jgi:uncharacterized protein YjdB